MKQKLLILLFTFLGLTTIYASFPVTENITTKAVIINESDPEPLTNGEKALWFFGGFLLTFIGLIIAIITQLSSKKKGQIKYALFGFGLYFLILFAILYIAIEGDIDISNIFIFG